MIQQLQQILETCQDREIRNYISKALARAQLLYAIEHTADNVKLSWREKCEDISLSDLEAFI